MTSATTCANISLKLAMKPNVYGTEVSNDGEGFFNSTELSSWKGMCKYYSGDANCKPNADILKISSNIKSAILNTTDWSSLPAIGGHSGMTADDAVEFLQICSDQMPEIISCENIKYTDYFTAGSIDETDQNGDTFVWETITEGARCQEVGYLYNLMCTRALPNDTNCTSVTSCEQFLEGLNSGYQVADAFCRDVSCASKRPFDTKPECEDYSADKMDEQYLMKDVYNNESLLDIHKKCQLNEKGVMNILKFNTVFMDFDDTLDKDHPVCVVSDAMDIVNATDQIQCQMLGAFQGEFTEYNIENGCVVMGSGSCATTSFALPLIYDNSTKDNNARKSPVPSFLKNLDVVIETVSYQDFGSILCNALSCDNYVGREGDSFSCEEISQAPGDICAALDVGNCGDYTVDGSCCSASSNGLACELTVGECQEPGDICAALGVEHCADYTVDGSCCSASSNGLACELTADECQAPGDICAALDVGDCDKYTLDGSCCSVDSAGNACELTADECQFIRLHNDKSSAAFMVSFVAFIYLIM